LGKLSLKVASFCHDIVKLYLSHSLLYNAPADLLSGH